MHILRRGLFRESAPQEGAKRDADPAAAAAGALTMQGDGRKTWSAAARKFPGVRHPGDAPNIQICRRPPAAPPAPVAGPTLAATPGEDQFQRCRLHADSGRLTRREARELAVGWGDNSRPFRDRPEGRPHQRGLHLRPLRAPATRSGQGRRHQARSPPQPPRRAPRRTVRTLTQT